MLFGKSLCSAGMALLLLASALLVSGGTAAAQGTLRCQTASLEGELEAGRGFERPIGGGLVLAFQPTASGWILRVWPTGADRGGLDMAALATPPYDSVTPLSLTTDFAFRAQDAVGWNPRHFRFATSRAQYTALQDLHRQLPGQGRLAASPVMAKLSEAVARTAEGTLTLLDVRLEAGTADQWRGAAAVATHFTQTAHTLVDPGARAATPLGRLLWARFRVELALPAGTATGPGWVLRPRSCGPGSQPR